jgi:hypothetical protein
LVFFGVLEVPGYEWLNGFPKDNSKYCIIIKGDIIHNATGYIGHDQQNFAVNNRIILDIVLADLSDI